MSINTLYQVIYNFLLYALLDYRKIKLLVKEATVYNSGPVIKEFNRPLVAKNSLFSLNTIKDYSYLYSILILCVLSSKESYKEGLMSKQKQSGLFLKMDFKKEPNTEFYILSKYFFFRYALIGAMFAAMFVYFSIFFKKASLLKALTAWACVFYFYYIIISGFVFFLKKYQFSKFTSAIQRFWKRSFIIFWSLEIFLFAIYTYLTFNSNTEPFYIYDNAQSMKTHINSFRSFYVKTPLLFLTILFLYDALVSLRWSTYSRLLFNFFFIVFIILISVWQEFYQFFYTILSYNDSVWVYDIDEHFWVVEQELKRTRLTNHYNHLVIILKFWHLVFISVFFFFLLSRSLDFSSFYYPSLGANFQNIVIFYFMYWILLHPLVKFYTTKSLSYQYYWFFLNLNKYTTFLFFHDFSSFFFNSLKLPLILTEYSFSLPNFYSYMASSSSLFGFFKHDVTMHALLIF